MATTTVLKGMSVCQSVSFVINLLKEERAREVAHPSESRRRRRRRSRLTWLAAES